jgi:phosphomannomutase
MNELTCFKAYDIRGKVPEELDEELAYKIGWAYSHIINPGTAIVGYDVRLESRSLTKALIKGLTDSGTSVINIGLCGTEEVYFHTFSNETIGVGGGIMITASHNPASDNGIKIFGSNGQKIADEIEREIEQLIEDKSKAKISQEGSVVKDER